MACDVKARLAPRGEKLFHAKPAVKADAKAVGLEHSVEFGEGRIDPPRIVVVGIGTSEATLVMNDVGRIGDDEINRFVGQLAKQLEAVAPGCCWSSWLCHLFVLRGAHGRAQFLEAGLWRSGGGPGGTEATTRSILEARRAAI